MTEYVFSSEYGEREVIALDLGKHGIHVYNPDDGEGVTISPDLRRAVGAQVFGGITDDFIDALVNAVWDNVSWDCELNREEAQTDVKALLDAFFGHV